MDEHQQDHLARRALSEVVPSGKGWGRANCPFCPLILGKTDRKRAFGIHLTSGKYHCFRCGTAGYLSDLTAVVLDDDVSEEVIVMRPPDGYSPIGEEPLLSAISAEPARTYLARRGIRRDLAREAKIGACLEGKYSGRVIVPILAPGSGTWLGWVGRAWSPYAERAYTYPKGMRRAEILYNHAALQVETDTPALIVEGVFDALAYWPDAVAVLGTFSNEQVEAMVSARRPIVSVLDGDAWRKGLELSLRLRCEGQRAGTVKLPPTKDPDEVDKAWLREEAVRSLEA